MYNFAQASTTREYALAVQEISMIEEIIQKWNCYM
jgi:hypothetical protein